MRIPDGYLCPISSVVMYGEAFPFWYIAARRLKTILESQMVSLLAILSALTFAVMMFMTPVSCGSTRLWR